MEYIEDANNFPKIITKILNQREIKCIHACISYITMKLVQIICIVVLKRGPLHFILNFKFHEEMMLPL